MFPIVILTSLSPLDFRLAFEEARQQTAERWRAQRREKALDQGVARRAERADAGGRSRPVGTHEKTRCEKPARIRTGEDPLGKAQPRTAQKGTGPRAQTARKAEAETVMDHGRSTAGGPHFRLFSCIYKHTFFGEHFILVILLVGQSAFKRTHYFLLQVPLKDKKVFLRKIRQKIFGMFFAGRFFTLF